MFTHLIVLVLGAIFCCLNTDLDLRYPPWRSNVWLDCFGLSRQAWELLQYILKVRSVCDIRQSWPGPGRAGFGPGLLVPNGKPEPEPARPGIFDSQARARP